MIHNVISLVANTKACPKCTITKSLSEFYKHQVNGYNSRCKECHKADCRARKSNTNPELAKVRSQKWRAKVMADPERRAKLREKKNDWNRSDRYFDGYFKRKFGISLTEVNIMLTDQNGLCANVGCSKEIAIDPKSDKAKAVVDHCHATGKVRALMCVRCNSLLGHIENNRSVVRGLMGYLGKHN